MISIYPTIYHKFQCKADQCENTCCQLWTIDIDEPTAERYHSMTGSLGESLRQAITVDDEGSHFIFSKAQPMCPLLNEKGLCKVVLELGEEGLCDTCHMHPRFYKYIEDLELCGVGLSCEASVELLAQQEPMDFLLFTIEDDHNEFKPEERLTLHNIFELLAFDLDPNLFQYTPKPSKQSFKELLDLYKQTEPIDENWTAQVNTLSSKLDQLIASVQTYIQQEDMSLFNKVYQYILYRQIDMLSDYSLESILAYAKDGTDYILIASALEGQPLKQVARWSQQIEYDEDNVELLLQHYEAQLG
ncbi:MAG: flagellin lysine-N-methylase [Veillonella sp.]|jgi:lysine-N-methylase|uniref:flagellin lysine-N-methylase n=1 Tax=Veillonella sp. TaxID=1926307 RepID=UPI00290AB736|nr:flagellin lysine-N-methylase [Veillonella sp.]MDU5869874.1 flagellin lysine-N-methylase [Veillonella sp.]